MWQRQMQTMQRNGIGMSAYNSNRKMFLRDAVKYELRRRLLGRYEELALRIDMSYRDENYIFVDPLFSGDAPAPDLPYLANSMKHARRWDLLAHGENTAAHKTYKTAVPILDWFEVHGIIMDDTRTAWEFFRGLDDEIRPDTIKPADMRLVVE